jgi:hypothetical protein
MKLKLSALLLFILLMGGWQAAEAQYLGGGSITASGSGCVTTNCVFGNLGQDTASVSFTVSGTYSGTLQFEVSQDGTHFVNINAYPPNSTTAVTGTTGTGTWTAGVAGMTIFRIRCSAYTSGTALVTINGSHAVATSTITAGGGGGGGGSYYQTIENDGSAQDQEPALNLIPGSNVTLGFTDTPGVSTNVTVNASGGGGDTITSPNSTLAVGGTSTNTTLDLEGAAGKIMAGATPALTPTPTLGVSGTAGNISFFPASGNFETTLGSAATASNTILFPATVPTTLYGFHCVVASTTCTLTSNGYAYNAIPIADLASSAITIAGTSVSLGGSTSSLPSPGVIGGTTPAAITGTTLTANTSITDSGLTASLPICTTSGKVLSSTCTALVTIADLNASGTPGSTTYLRGDGSWSTPSGSGTVNSGTSGQDSYYASTGAAVSGINTAGGGSNPLWGSITSLAQGQQICADATPKLINCTPGVVPNPQTGTTYPVVQGDNGKYLSFSNASSIAVTVPSAASLSANFAFRACDIGTGTATLTPTTSTISYTTGNSYTSAASSMALTTGECANVYSDNTNYFANQTIGGSGTGLSGMTSGQVPVAASATTVTSSKALAGSGSGITTGPTSATSLDVAEMTGTSGQIADGGVLVSKLTQTICSGTIALGTSAIASGAAATTVTATCTGLATTDTMMLSFNGSPLAVTGYVPSASGMLTIIDWPTSNTINVSVVNNTASSVTPGAITLNYRVTR